MDIVLTNCKNLFHHKLKGKNFFFKKNINYYLKVYIF